MKFTFSLMPAGTRADNQLVTKPVAASSDNQ
jgi:hypothetical protein